MQTDEVKEKTGKRRRSALQFLWLWVLVVVLYFSWEVATYRGLFARISEWQFERLGQDLPTFNFGLLSMAFAWPALLLVRLASRNGDDEEDDAHPVIDPAARRDTRMIVAIVDTAEEYMHFLFGFAAALVIAALVALVWTLFLPSFNWTPVPLAPYAAQAAAPREGPTSFEGQLTYGRIASFGRGIVFLRHTVLYAPIKPPAGTDPRIRYFVEFMPAERTDVRSGGTLSHRTGLLVRGDMPGALLKLYRYLGYRIAPRYYVLYASAATLRWPYYMLAIQFAIGAIAFLLAALWQRLHIRRLGEDVAEMHRRTIAARERRRLEIQG